MGSYYNKDSVYLHGQAPLLSHLAIHWLLSYSVWIWHQHNLWFSWLGQTMVQWMWWNEAKVKTLLCRYSQGDFSEAAVQGSYLDLQVVLFRLVPTDCKVNWGTLLYWLMAGNCMWGEWYHLLCHLVVPTYFWQEMMSHWIGCILPK